jgi:hypothetical protein
VLVEAPPFCNKWRANITVLALRYATFAGLAGVSTFDHAAAAAKLPPVDSLDMWPLLSGANATSPRDTVLVTKSLLLHKQWKYSRGPLIEVSDVILVPRGPWRVDGARGVSRLRTHVSSKLCCGCV